LDPRVWIRCLLGKFLLLSLNVYYSPDGEVIVTNDGATILDKMEVRSLPYWYQDLKLLNRSITRPPDYWSNYLRVKMMKSVTVPPVLLCLLVLSLNKPRSSSIKDYTP
jgi:hypothetical protein